MKKYFSWVFPLLFIVILWSCNDKDIEGPILDSSKTLNIESVKFETPGENRILSVTVTPSDAFKDLNLDASNCELSFISTEDKPYEIINGRYEVSDFFQVNSGKFTIELSDKSSLYSYSDKVILSIIFTDENGQLSEVRSNSFTISRSGEFDELAETGLPVVMINTPGGVAITSKDVWAEDVTMNVYTPDGILDYSGPLSMKGRGNSTWGLPKKPYALKLDKKSEILSMPKHKRWVLLANFYDKSNLRTDLAFHMGNMSEALGYSPRTKFVNYVMNGQYEGLYTLTEQLKIDENRVSFGENNHEDGFLMEIDARAGQDPEDIYFRIGHIPQPLVIKDPDVVIGDENYEYLVAFMQEADNSLFSEEWLDQNNGYKNYIEIESFVDWYLINEIARNNDAIFLSSCYMNLERGGKLKMGPLWDFDLAFGNYKSLDRSDPNHSDEIEGFWIKKVAWYSRMFQDPEFVSLLKQRFDFYYQNQNELYDLILDNKDMISKGILQNDNKWHFYSSSDDENAILTAHSAECNQMIEWIKARMDWLKSQFEAL